MQESNLKTYKIRILDYNFNELTTGFQIEFDQDSTYQELKNYIIEKFPDILDKDYILSINGYNPELTSKIDKKTQIITLIQENNEPIIDINKLPMNDHNEEEDEESENSFDDGFGILLGDLLKKGKNDNLGKKRERENSFEEQENLIKFNEDFEIISDFAPSNNELFNIFFNDEPLSYNTNKRLKKIINPEKIIQQNNLNRNYLDIEYLTVQSIKNDEIEFNEKKDYTQEEEIIRRKIINEDKKDIIQKDLKNLDCKEERKEVEINEEIGERKEEEIKEKKIEEETKIEEKQEISEENIIKEEIKEENIKKEEIKEENIKKEDIKEENIIKKDIKEENIKNEDIKEENIIKEDIKEKNNKITKNENIIKKHNKSIIKNYLDNNKYNIKQILLDFYNYTSFPNFEERIKYAKIINYLKNYRSENRKQKKINFVFDLDNTLIYGTLLNNQNNLKLKINNNYIYEKLEIHDTVFIFYFHIRNGIEKLFEEIKDIGNFYIYTLAVLPYALKIKSKIEQLCNITFIRMNCNEGSAQLKFLDSLEINPMNTLILDDTPIVWNGDAKVFNVIPSKWYYNENIMKIAKQSYSKKIKRNDKKMEFSRYLFFNYINEGEDWLNNQLEKVKDCAFNNLENKQYYYIENENSQKNQLEYIGKVYKTVYNILEFGDYNAMVAVKMIKTVLFAGMIFDLDYYKDNDNQYDILKKMIIICGGEEYKENTNIINNVEFVYICNKNNLYKVDNKYIEETRKIYKQFYIVDESYVFDCNFCITKFSPLEYQLNI